MTSYFLLYLMFSWFCFFDWYIRLWTINLSNRIIFYLISDFIKPQKILQILLQFYSSKISGSNPTPHICNTIFSQKHLFHMIFWYYLYIHEVFTNWFKFHEISFKIMWLKLSAQNLRLQTYQHFLIFSLVLVKKYL